MTDFLAAGHHPAGALPSIPHALLLFAVFAFFAD
jgi:hypothetical protein